MKIKKSALIVLRVVSADILSTGHQTHKDYLSHGRSRISPPSQKYSLIKRHLQ